MAERELTCIVCPSGCKIKCETDDDGNIISVTGYTCRRGHDYAVQELTYPVRTLTSTVRAVVDGRTFVVPVRTTHGIPKNRMAEAMKIIRGITLTEHMDCGESIIIDFMDRGTNLIVCRDV